MQLLQFAHGYYDTMEQHAGYGLLGLLFMLLLWAGIIGLAVYLLRGAGRNNMAGTGRIEPLDIARERYAKGEITKEELADIKKELAKK